MLSGLPGRWAATAVFTGLSDAFFVVRIWAAGAGVAGTLQSADWQNSTLIPAASAFAEIAELKQRPGKNIGMTGSGTLVSSLLREGLLDELHLFVFPLVVGSGKRLFGASDAQLPLKLLDSATFQSGVVHSTYAKA